MYAAMITSLELGIALSNLAACHTSRAIFRFKGNHEVTFCVSMPRFLGAIGGWGYAIVSSSDSVYFPLDTINARCTPFAYRATALENH